MFETERETIGNAEANVILRNHSRQASEVITGFMSIQSLPELFASEFKDRTRKEVGVRVSAGHMLLLKVIYSEIFQKHSSLGKFKIE